MKKLLLAAALAAAFSAQAAPILQVDPDYPGLQLIAEQITYESDIFGRPFPDAEHAGYANSYWRGVGNLAGCLYHISDVFSKGMEWSQLDKKYKATSADGCEAYNWQVGEYHWTPGYIGGYSEKLIPLFAVPEPGTLALLGLGLVGLALRRNG